MPALLDISKLPDHACEAGLDAMFKAATGGGDDGVWEPHESPFIRQIIELFTQRGLTQIDAVRRELDEWIAGEMHQPSRRQPTPPGAVGRWTPSEQKLVRLYLQSMDPGKFAPEDWSLLVDYLAQRYLPPEFALQAADWLTAKSVVMGKVEALAGRDLTDEQAEALAMAAPDNIIEAEQMGMNEHQKAVLRYGNTRCAENIVALTDTMRHRIKRVILNHQQAEYSGDKAATAEALQTKLLDEFGTLNRDWRRIALTEAAENSNQGFVGTMPTGATLKRLEQYKGACAFCRRIDGREFSVVAPSKTFKDPQKEIWVGKTNVGRAAAPMKRVAGTLVARDPSEMWWPAAGVQHPHCRGRWIPVRKVNLSGDDDFHAWMAQRLAATKPKRDDDDSD